MIKNQGNNYKTNDEDMFKEIIQKEKRIKELIENNNYDQKIVSFYNNGILTISGIDFLITKINILEDDKNNTVLDIVDDRIKLPENFKIKKITSFRDTSLFEKLIIKYKDEIKNNKLSISNDIFNELVNTKWDGKYHNLVPETTYLNEKINKPSVE